MCSKEIQHNVSDFCHLSGEKVIAECKFWSQIPEISALSTIQKAKVIEITCIMK